MRKHVLLTVLVCWAVVSCSTPGSTQSQGSAAGAEPGPIDVEAFAGELPIAPPWLREQLPAGLITYERIPHPLGLMAMPKGNVLDTALASDANIRNLISIQQGLFDNLGVELPPLRLLEHLRSPIEIAAVGVSALVGATLDFRSDAEFEAFLAELGQFAPVSLVAPLDDEGFGVIAGLPAQIHVNFDETSGRLALYASFMPTRAAFASLLAAESAAAHPMHALERQIDDSGQGLFAWVDAAQAIQSGRMFNPGLVEQLMATGADQIRAIAFGAGVANGKGRLKLLADLGTDITTRPIPIIENSITAASVGAPRSLFLLSIPGAGEFSRLESIILDSVPPEAAAQWRAVTSSFGEVTGTTIDEILTAIGPELIGFSDEAGSYLGLRVRDHDGFDDLVSSWTDYAGVPVEERTVRGQTIRSVSLPGTIGMPRQVVDGEAAAIFNLLGRMRNRVYWVADGDYVYLASTPQLLIDRISMGADTSVAEWLDETQRFDVSSSLLAVTGSVANLPDTMYNAYIGMMQGFADLVGVEYDIWAMPTANQLRLPDRGALGASVNLGQPYVSLELSYESHPAELLLGGGGVAAMLAAGVAAAVALPAFQDYQERVREAEGAPSEAAFRR